MITEKDEALVQLADFVVRVTHWKEGGADRHTALKALETLQEGPTTPSAAQIRNPVMAETGEVLGAPYPDWPDWCTTFLERLAYQHGIADARLHAVKVTPAPFIHKKTGGKYQFVGNARLQTSVSLDDMAYVVVYRGEDGKLWVRASDEFMDRFQQEGRPNRMMCDDVLEAEAEAGGVLAISPELYARMNPDGGSNA